MALEKVALLLLVASANGQSTLSPVESPTRSPTNCHGVVESRFCSLSAFDCDIPGVAALCPFKCTGGCNPTISPTAPTSAPTSAPTPCLADIDEGVCDSLFTRSHNTTATAQTDECCTTQLARFCPTTCCGFLENCAPTVSPTISPSVSPTTSIPSLSPTSSFPTTAPSRDCNDASLYFDLTACNGSESVFSQRNLSIFQVCELSGRDDYDQFSAFIPPYADICNFTCCEATSAPTMTPTVSPTDLPSSIPTASPSCSPDTFPDLCNADECCHDLYGPAVMRNCPESCCGVTCSPTISPTFAPTATPTVVPSNSPSTLPSFFPTRSPTASPSLGCQPDDVPADLVELLMPCSGSCCNENLEVKLLAQQFCSTSCCNVTCSPTPSPTSQPTANPTENSPTAAPSFSPTTSPTFTPDAVGAVCVVELCCNQSPLVTQLYLLECATTCGPVVCLTTTVPTTTASTTTVTTVVLETSAPTSVVIPTTTFTSVTLEPTSPSPSSSEPTSAPSDSQEAQEAACVANTCGKDCKQECGWDELVGRCVPGAATNNRDKRRGWGCAGADDDRCNVFSCGARCSIAAGCGWSKSKSRCVTGGFTQQQELGMGYCDLRAPVIGEWTGTMDWLPSYSRRSTVVADGDAVMGETEMFVYEDGTTLVTIEIIGLNPNTVYNAHLHSQPCSENGGRSYQNPSCAYGCAVNAINENWPGFITNPDGTGIGGALSTWIPNPSDFQDLSVVIYDTSYGERMLCADLTPMYLNEGVTTTTEAP